MSASHHLPTVIYLPGMQGAMLSDRWFVRGLRGGGLKRCRTFDWTRSRWWLVNLRNRRTHRQGAVKLARWIARRKQRRPSQPIVLIGHSTGAMVILDALERLDAPHVDAAWFIAAAVSSNYDLSAALNGARRLVNMHSPGDWLVLGAGTTLFGTADGLYRKSAGFSGFTGTGSDDPRLRQVPYDPKWLASGHLGGHTTPLFRLFARDVLGPMVLAELSD